MEVVRSVAFIVRLLTLSLVGVSVMAPLRSVAEDLEAIRQRGQIIVGIKDNLAPLGFVGSNGQLQGLEVDIARRLAQELLGKRDGLVLKPVLNQERIGAVLDGRVDIAIAHITQTISRSRVVAFSTPYYQDGTALVAKNAALQKPSDLRNQKVAVLNNSTTVDVIRDRLPQAKMVGVPSYEAALNLLERGEVAAFAADATVLVGWVRQFPQYRLLSPTLSVEPLVIVLPKGLQYDELRREINQILERWQAEGWLRQRATYWGLP